MTETKVVPTEVHMTPERLAEFLHKSWPDLIPEVIDLYEEHYSALPWQKDPIRGGYHFSQVDLAFLNELSAIIKAYKKAAGFDQNTVIKVVKELAPQEAPLIAEEPAGVEADSLEPILDPKAEQIKPVLTTPEQGFSTPKPISPEEAAEIQKRMIEYAEKNRPQPQPVAPGVVAEGKLHRDTPIEPPRQVVGKTSFANLEAQIKSGNQTIDNAARGKSIEAALAPLTAEVSGSTNHTIKIEKPNPTKAMADLAQRKQELENARSKSVSGDDCERVA
jgi:hypothetical protein